MVKISQLCYLMVFLPLQLTPTLFWNNDSISNEHEQLNNIAFV